MAPKKLPASKQKKSAQNYSKNPASREHKNAQQRIRNRTERTAASFASGEPVTLETKEDSERTPLSFAAC